MRVEWDSVDPVCFADPERASRRFGPLSIRWQLGRAVPPSGTVAAERAWGPTRDPNAPVQLNVPVNKLPEFVRYLVQRLKALGPSLGRVKIPEILAWAGPHLGVTTIGRIRKEKPAGKPPTSDRKASSKPRVVTSKHPNHLWQIDLTVVPILGGLWTSWLPFSLPQCWPFCWWVAVVLDHFSRRGDSLSLADLARCSPNSRVSSWGGRFPAVVAPYCGT
jgi:transposase InsO family protein